MTNATYNFLTGLVVILGTCWVVTATLGVLIAPVMFISWAVR